MVNAYICEIDPALTNQRPVDHAQKIVQYLPLIQEKISEMPMQMTIYLEFCGKALAKEAGRLRSTGWHQGPSFSNRLDDSANLAIGSGFLAGKIGGANHVYDGESGAGIRPSVSRRACGR